MKYQASLLVCFFAAFTVLNGQIALGEFDRIDAFGNLEITLVHGDEPSYSVNGDSEDLKIRLENFRLKISHKQNADTWSSPIDLTVTYTNLTMLNASSGTNVRCSEVLQSENIELNFDMGASGRIELDADEIIARSGEGANLELEGEARTLEVSVSTGGRVDASDLEALRVNANANTGGRARIHVVEYLEARASIGGNIRYSGDPEHTSINESIGGNVYHQ